MAGNGGKKSAVPKFASFKPKLDESPILPAPSGPKDRESAKEQRKRDPGPKDHQHHRSSHTKSHPRHPRQPSPSHERPPPPPTHQDTPIFIVDKRGDPLIVRYGSNDRSKVPTYRRSGAGRVLGADGRIRFIYDGSKAMFSLGDRPGEGPSAFRDRNMLAKASRKKSKVFRLRTEPDQTQRPQRDDELDFLPLSESHKKKGDTSDLDDSPKGKELDYRSIQGKAKARDFVDSDLESADSSDDDAGLGIDSSSPARQRSIELSRRVKDHPEDVDAWIELVQLQETLLQLDENTRQDRAADESKGLASVRVSLLEEALPHAPNNSSRERLLLRLMREGSRTWSSKVLAKRWAEILTKDSSFALWRAHLDFELSHMTTFTYDGLKNIHFDRLRLLRQRLLDAGRTSSDIHNVKPSKDLHDAPSGITNQLENICDEFIYVFLRTTCFIRDAGYTELAIAAWQAILELTFAGPDDEVGLDPAELMPSFRDFWESEVPRMGEDGAKGWRQFIQAGEMADLPDMKTQTTHTPPDTRDVYKAWAAVETQRSQGAALPARTLDEGTEDDPFRVVMFSDLEPLLFTFPPAIHAQSKIRSSLLDAFLLFCRLPPASKGHGKMMQDMRDDPFILQENIGLERTSLGQESHTEDGEKLPPRFLDPGRRLIDSADVLFPGPNWFGLFNHEPSPDYDLALATTMQLATSFQFESIANYSLGLAWNKNPTTIRKVAKALLKKWPNNTSLYNAYAMAEWRNGNRDVARNVLLSATSQELHEKELLWVTWAWLDLEAGDSKSTLARCVAASMMGQGDGSKPTATYSQLLKARQTLSSSRGFLLSAGNVRQAALFAWASALLEYVSAFVDSTEPTAPRQGNLEAAMDIIHTFTSEAIDRGHESSPVLERLLQFAAHLLYLHAARGLFRPTYLRDQLHRFIMLFPCNTIFLRLFAWADTSILINDPVRDLLRTHTLTRSNDCVTSRIFALQHESRAGTVHSVRAAFERAIDSDACRCHVGMWRSYVRFCQRHRGALKGSVVAKEVYYRAISSCPRSKVLAMEAFTTLVRDMDSGELRAVFNTMTAKGLRIHVDLEEFAENWSRKKGT